MCGFEFKGVWSRVSLGYQDLGFALGLRPSKERDLGLRIEETLRNCRLLKKGAIRVLSN